MIEKRFNYLSQVFFNIGAWSAVVLCFSVAAIGTAVNTVTIIMAAVFLILSARVKEYPDVLRRYDFALIAVLLFVFIGISLIWSESVSDGLSIWKKYKEFIFIPVLLIYFSRQEFLVRAKVALFSGMIISLIFSYLVFFDIVNNPPRQHSIANHIFNGILISFFGYWALILAAEYKKYRIPLCLLYMASLFTMFIIRDGRLGFLLTIVLFSLFIFQYWRWKGMAYLCAIASILIIVLMVFLKESALAAYGGNIQVLLSLDSLAQMDIRLEFYINTLRMVIDNWLLGVGVGDFPSAYREVWSLNQHYWPATVNPHNEYLMIAAQVGVVGLVMFFLFFFFLIKNVKNLNVTQAHLATATIFVIGLSCMFNSSFLDHNDGTLLALLVSLFFIKSNRAVGVAHHD